MKEISLILIDLQNDYLDPGSSNVGHLTKAVCLSNVLLLLSHARDRGWQIIHVRTVHESDETLPKRLRMGGNEPYCISGTKGAEIVDRIKTKEEESVIEKKGYSAFQNTKLDEIVNNSGAVVIGGVAADCCVEQTAIDASNLDKEVYLPYQSTAASNAGDYISHLRSAGKSIGAVLDLFKLIESGEPIFDNRIPTDDLEKILYNWIKPRLDCAQNLESKIKNQKTLLFEEILQMLDHEIGKIS